MGKKFISILIICCIAAAAVFSGCSPDTGQEMKAAASQDKYRNYYEIFVSSFCDSNGDGIGDIGGIISKLDYLNDGDPNSGDDLGIDGIWLMPIMPSPSYHKYDVTDYYDIDPQYGTMEDFEKLIAECDKRGIDVIIDLVINHTSSEHPWFKKAKAEIAQGNLDGYAKLYSIAAPGERDTKYGYQFITGTKYSFECNFSGGMPDLDLSSDQTRDEIKKIMQFWIDKGVAGFRLDAVKFFDSPNTERVEFMNWMYSTAKEMKEDVYMVGEDWDGNSAIATSYESGVDSFFNFTFSASGGKINSAINSKNAKSILKSDQKWNEIIKGRNENGIDAVFLSNHDMKRSAAAFSGDLVKMKTAASLYMMMPGNSFIYYGEELGLLSGENDASYRIPIPWSYDGDKSGTVTELPPGVVEEQLPEWNPKESAQEQQKDANSLFSHYQNIIRIKLQNPEIARGTIKKLWKRRLGTLQALLPNTTVPR